MPEMPEAMKEPTEEGLEAALEYWWEAGYYLQLTGDSSPLEAVSNADCILCEELVNDWTGIYGVDGWSTGAKPNIPTSVFNLENQGDTATMIFETTEGPSALYKPGGEEVDPEDSDKTFKTSWTGSASFDTSRGHWLIDELVAQGDLDG
ncbi:hypothetical protein IMT31_00675 [Citricoccus nitrophenolicus]